MNQWNKPLVVLVAEDSLTTGEVRSALGNRVQLVHAADVGSARRYVHTCGKNIDIILCDRGLPVSANIEFFNEIAAYYPHIQLVQAFQDGELGKIIEIKNQVTSMSVCRLPWDADELEGLFALLLERGRIERRREGILQQSLVDEFRKTRDNRMFLLYQAFSEGANSARGGKLLPYFATAKMVQPQEEMADLNSFDSFVHAAEEARRMVAIASHVRRWLSEWSSAGGTALATPFLEPKEGAVRVTNPGQQLSPINGPCYQDPGYEACGLMAWLLMQPERMDISFGESGDLIVGPAITKSPS